jgi:methylated-DNA-[protein]-cysteine S-methyltransferase
MAAGMTERFAATSVPTPLGELTAIVSPVGVVATFFDDEDADLELERLEARLGSSIVRAGRGLSPIRREIDAYFRGSKRAFLTPVDLSLAGAGFPRRVLEATMRIPYGRAAGNALNRCPVELFVPCHRVVHAGGTIGGYGRYENRKRWLLHHESAI